MNDNLMVKITFFGLIFLKKQRVFEEFGGFEGFEGFVVCCLWFVVPWKFTFYIFLLYILHFPVLHFTFLCSLN